MKTYKIKISEGALSDIQDATNWYNEQVPALGSRYQKAVIQQINSLKNNFNAYNIRYGDVRCSLVKKFPFLIHYVVDDENQQVEIFAVIHTSRNPKIWEIRRNNT